MKILDFRDLTCPAPVVETRKALLAAPGESRSVLLGDTMARDNVRRMAQTLGYTVAVLDTGDGFQLDLAPDETAAPRPDSSPADTGKTVVYIGNNSMGGDNRELGQKLMVAFLGSLLEVDPKPDWAIFINEGVRLTTEGSPALEALEKLAVQGTNIVSCGLCLDYFDLKDQLQVGRVGNMYETAEAFLTAKRIIRP